MPDFYTRRQIHAGLRSPSDDFANLMPIGVTADPGTLLLYLENENGLSLIFRDCEWRERYAPLGAFPIIDY
jgi:hypothetical protein